MTKQFVFARAGYSVVVRITNHEDIYTASFLRYDDNGEIIPEKGYCSPRLLKDEMVTWLNRYRHFIFSS